jgi:type IV secretory pathway VirB2 component (pilin)
MIRRNTILYFLVCSLVVFLFPEIALASVESTLSAIQTKLITTILPLVAIIGLLFAGFSFVSGNANARAHLFLAVMGAIIGFGAPSIVAFIRGLVQ